MDQPSDRELGRLLGRGKPGGPEADQLWARVEGTLDAQPAAPAGVGAFLRRWMLPLTMVPAVAAAALLLVPRTDGPALTARGAGDQLVTLSATCGGSGAPCRVGERVRLSVHAGEKATWALVQLRRGEQGTTLHGPAPLRAGESVSLPVELEPEGDDVAGGITLVVFAQPVVDGSSVPSVEQLRARSDASHTLRLAVVAAERAP